MFQEEVLTTSYLAAIYLKEQNFNKKVYVVGSTGITQELDNVDIKYLPIGVRILYNINLIELKAHSCFSQII